MSPARPLRFIHFGELACSIRLYNSFLWHDDGQPILHNGATDGLSSSDDLHGSSTSCGTVRMSSDSEPEDIDTMEYPVGEVLANWDLDMACDKVPILMMPEPIVYLIAKRKWSTVLLRTAWHEFLVSSTGQRDCDGHYLFPNIHWPPADSPVWELQGQSCTLPGDGDIAELNSQDRSTCFS